MIAGAVKFIEGKRKSEGGLPMGTGWLKDGLWVAMALGSIARTYLRLGLYQRAYQYLYPALNHASPYVTYCEERGVEKGSAEKTGDMQHLWTPLSVCQYMVEAFWFEDEKAVHLCAGIVPEWLTEGKTIGITGLKTHYGDTAMRVAYAGAYAQLQINTERPMEKDVLLHLPDGTGSIVDRVVAAAGKTAVSARVALF